MGIRFGEALIDETIFITEDKAKLKISATSSHKILSRGKNRKNICIVYKLHKNSVLEEPSMQILLNLIKAIQCTEDDVAIVHAEDVQGNIYRQVKIHCLPKYLLCFGISAEEMGLHLQPLKNFVFSFDGVHFLFTDPIERLTDKQTKAPLWLALQTMFQL